jgi:hypothetical protein
VTFIGRRDGGVGVGSGVAVGEGVGVAVGTAVGVDVAVGVLVAVPVGVSSDSGVADAVGVASVVAAAIGLPPSGVVCGDVSGEVRAVVADAPGVSAVSRSSGTTRSSPRHPARTITTTNRLSSFFKVPSLARAIAPLRRVFAQWDDNTFARSDHSSDRC